MQTIYYMESLGDHGYVWPTLTLFLFVFIGIFGNTLVCLSIKLDPKLKNATNNYLFSLALIDLLVSVLVIPFAIIKHFFNNIWIFGNIFCTVWIFLDVFLCTASILLLCVISCDRYKGIKEPLKGIEKSKSKTNLIILFVCLIALLISLPIILLSYLDAENIIRNGNCSIYNNNFKIYGSIFSFIIPLGIMMIMYYLTVKRLKIVLNEFKLKCQKNNMRLSISSSLVDENAKSKMKRIEEIHQLALRLKNTHSNKKKPKDAASNKTNSSLVKSHNDLVLKTNENNLIEQINQQQKSSTSSINKITNFKKISLEKLNKSRLQLNNSDSNNINNFNNNFSEKSPGMAKKPSRFKLMVNKHLIARQAVDAFKLSRESSVVKNQQKAVKVLGIVQVIFLIAWAPFSLVNILSAACESCSINMFTLDIFTWLGYISSTVNPLIYNAFNSNFRHAFKQILKCNSSSLKKATYTRKQSNIKMICNSKLNPLIKKESKVVTNDKIENGIGVATTLIKPNKKVKKQQVIIKKSMSEVNVLARNFYDAI